jgi:glyoxylase-like metal-dependent hydrolase (beta-lactamase superfamily II)
LPTKTIGAHDSETIDGVRFEFLHVANAHTSGDLVIYLPDAKMVFTGDIIADNSAYPIIHMEKHGSSQGWIDTVTAMLAFDADKFIPGHGTPHTKADIEQRLDAVKSRTGSLSMRSNRRWAKQRRHPRPAAEARASRASRRSSTGN